MEPTPPWEIAKSLLVHYFRLTAKKSGADWTADNQAEIESIVNALREGVLAEIKSSKTRKEQP